MAPNFAIANPNQLLPWNGTSVSVRLFDDGVIVHPPWMWSLWPIETVLVND